MAKKINPWDNGGDDNGIWTTEGDIMRRGKIIDFTKISKLQAPNDNWGGYIKYGLLIVLALWLISGFYQVQPSEQGVVLRFGKYLETTDAGLHYHLPTPIEEVIKVNVTQERSINLGTMDNRYRNARNNAFTESHMLTGDENIVDINLTVVWKIKDAKNYLFSMRSPDETVSVAAQSVLREIVGQSEMQPIITGDRGKVEDDTKERLLMPLTKFNAPKPIWNASKMRQRLIVTKLFQMHAVKQRKFRKRPRLIVRRRLIRPKVKLNVLLLSMKLIKTAKA